LRELAYTCSRQKVLTAIKAATAQLHKLEQKPDPLQEAPALERKVAKALALHHGALTSQIEAVVAQWELLQQQVVAEMSWRELDMQVGHVLLFRGLQGFAAACACTATALRGVLACQLCCAA
jgi:hypothetical protein